MTKSVDLSAIEPIADSNAASQLPMLPPTSESAKDVGATSLPTSYEGSTNAPTPLWQPTEPQFTKAIAEYYGVSRKSVQEWFQKVKEACPWFTEADLKLPDERYTPIAISLMGRYRLSGLPFKVWKAQIWDENPELVAAFQSAQAAHSPQPSLSDDRSGGLTLHPGANLALPVISEVMPTGDEAAYLAQMRQRLEQFEHLQQQVVTQMQEQFEQAQSLNAQYQEAMSLSDQLLLQEFQLKGVQLGYTALQLKQQAFKATIQAVEAGTLPLPGKYQSEPGEPQPA